MANPFRKVAQAAIRAAGSVGARETWTLIRTDSDYDPATGTNTQVTFEYTWPVIVEYYAQGAIDGMTVMAGDRRIIGAAADLDVTPDAQTDSIRDPDDKTYTIVPEGLTRDPAGATWMLQVRR